MRLQHGECLGDGGTRSLHQIGINLKNHLSDRIVLKQFARSFQHIVLETLSVNFKEKDIFLDDLVNPENRDDSLFFLFEFSNLDQATSWPMNGQLHGGSLVASSRMQKVRLPSFTFEWQGSSLDIYGVTSRYRLALFRQLGM